MGMTNAQVAAAMEISRSYLSDMEHGRGNPSLDLLAKLAVHYKTTTDFFLGLTADPRVPGTLWDAEGFRQRDTLSIINELSDEQRAIVTRLAMELRTLEKNDRERALGRFMLRMMEDIEERLGEQAAEELTDALDLFTDSGDDSRLRTWFARYLSGSFGANNLLPH